MIEVFFYYQHADVNKHKYMTMDTSNYWEWTLEEMLDMKYLKQAVPGEQIVYLTVDDKEKTRRIEIRKFAAINAFYENADCYGFQSFSRDGMKSPTEMLNVVEAYLKL